jgi:hypothetical protein
MTSNMIHWTPSTPANAHRGEDLDTRRERSLSSFARARRELQQIVDQAVAAGVGRRELAGMPAFRAHLRRALAFGGELQLTSDALPL